MCVLVKPKITDKELDEAYELVFGSSEARKAEPIAGTQIQSYSTPAPSIRAGHIDLTKLTRADILAKAADCVTGNRVDDYGKPEDSFGRIAQLWTAYNGRTYTAHDVAMMLALLKVARISTGHGGADSYVDLAGYAACAGELAGTKDN